MKIQRVRGTRDVYPEDMVVRNWIVDAWRRVSIRNGFVEFDGPMIEYLDLYRAKSGEELVGELFSINSRGGEELGVRPEMTPTLARMINARVHALPRPIKWFSLGAVYRGERPQRGRMREFLQWNIDIVGVDELVADAESIFVAVDLMREVGLTPQDVVVWINDRRLMGALFDALGIPEERHGRAYGLVDRSEKMERAQLAAAWNGDLGDAVSFDRFEPLLALDSLAALRSCDEPVLARGEVAERVRALDSLFMLLQDFGITEFCDFNMKIVRGLAYYTGCVYEAFDRKGELRAILGGGRYDSLLEALGGPSVSGVGFGMGDAVLGELLSELGRLPSSEPRLDVYLVAADDEASRTVVQLAAKLRSRGVGADFGYRRQAVGKQFKAAAARGAARCVVVGAETRERGTVTVKDMATGKQAEMPVAGFLDDAMAPVT